MLTQSEKSLSQEEIESIVQTILADGTLALNKEKAISALQGARYDNPEHEYDRIVAEFMTPHNLLVAEHNLILAAQNRVAAIQIRVAEEPSPSRTEPYGGYPPRRLGRRRRR